MIGEASSNLLPRLQGGVWDVKNFRIVIAVIILILLFSGVSSAGKIELGKNSEKKVYNLGDTVIFSLKVCNPDFYYVIVDVYDEWPDGNNVLNYEGELIQEDLFLNPGQCWNVNRTYVIVEEELSPDERVWNWLYINGFNGKGELLFGQVVSAPRVVMPPDSVKNLRNITYEQTYINWTWDNPSNFDFSHVMVYIDGVWMTNTSGNWYLATGLTPDTEHTISTRTVDTKGDVNQTWVNHSARTAPSIAPSIIHFSPPSPVYDTEGDLRTFSVTTDQVVNVVWYKNGTIVQTNMGVNSASWTGTAVVGTWNITAVVTNANGGDSNTWIWIVEEADTTPPGPVTGLGSITGNFWINWTWNNPTDPDFSHVMVYIDGVWQGNTSGESFFWSTTPHQTHTINVCTVDTTGNVNPSCSSQVVTIPNNPPVMGAIPDQTVNEGDIVIVDADATDLDSDTLTYSCNRTDLFSFDTSTGFGSWNTASGDAGIYYVLFGVSDGWGGSDSEVVKVTVMDATPPSTITDLHNITYERNYITWVWNNPPDADFSHVMVYLDGVFKVNTSGTTYNATGLTAETMYTISTRTVDLSGNINPTWVNHSAETAPLPAPSIITYSPPSPVYDTEGALRTFSVTADQLVTVSWYLNGSLVQSNGSVTSASWTGIAVLGTWNVTAVVSNANGADSNTWVWIVSSGIDLPPASITNLTNTTYDSSYIIWEWDNPSDPDFSHVMIYIDGVWQTNTSNNFYSATGLSPNTAYTISTHTVDTSGNINQTWVNHTSTTAPLPLNLYFPHAPDSQGWRSFFSVMNTADANSSIDIKFFDNNANLVHIEPVTLIPNEKFDDYPSDVIGSDFVGTIRVESNKPGVAGMLYFRNNEGNLLGSYEAILPDKTIYFPHVHDGQGWSSFFSVMNVGTQNATVQLRFLDTRTDTVYIRNVTLLPNEKYSGYPNNLLGTGVFFGTLRADSDMPLVGMLNFRSGNVLGTYSTIAPNETLYFPHVHEGSGWRSYFSVMNTGSTTNVQVKFYDSTGSLIHTELVTLAQNEKYSDYPINVLGSDFVGTIKVESSTNQPLIGMLNFRDNAKNIFGTYSTVETSAKVNFPYAKDGGGWVSYFSVMNTGSTTNVQVNFYDNLGGLIHTKTINLTTNEKFSDYPKNLVGSDFEGTIIAESDKPLIGILNFRSGMINIFGSYSGV